MINKVEELHGVNVFFVYVRCGVCSCAVGMDEDSKGCACSGCPSHCFCRKIDFNACYNNNDKQIIIFFHCRSSCNSQMRFNILSQT